MKSALARLLGPEVTPRDVTASGEVSRVLNEMRWRIDALGVLGSDYSYLSPQVQQRRLTQLHSQLRDLRDELAHLLSTGGHP